MVDGVRDIDRTDEVIDAVENGMDEFIETVFEATTTQIQSNMSSGKDAMGRSWAPLQPETVAAKGHSTPLMDSGDLQVSIEADSELDLSSRIAIFASSLPYAGVHEFGWPERNVPPRPFLQPGLEYAAEISDDVWDEEVDARVQANLL